MSKSSTSYDSSQRACVGGSRQDSMTGMDLREQSERMDFPSSGCRVLTLQGKDIRAGLSIG